MRDLCHMRTNQNDQFLMNWKSTFKLNGLEYSNSRKSGHSELEVNLQIAWFGIFKLTRSFRIVIMRRGS
jgi:hypothetical protein